MNALAFGDWLKRRRRSLDLTQDELADRAGCSVETIRKLEAETLRPSKALAERLAEYLAIPPEQQAQFVRFARGQTLATMVDLWGRPLPRGAIVAPADGWLIGWTNGLAKYAGQLVASLAIRDDAPLVAAYPGG